MTRCDHILLMARYNGWMNQKLYDAAKGLAPEELARNSGAFFGSILGTLNHLVVADTIWLKRFTAHPANYAGLDFIRGLPQPASLDQLLFSDINALWPHRRLLDERISIWVQEIREPDLDHVLHYANTKGVKSRKVFFSLVMHFFNHQTHHRGQTSTLLSQAGVDIGVTDLLALVPNEDETQSRA